MTTTKDIRFSIFPCGYWDERQKKAMPQQRQQQTQTIKWVAEYITSERARRVTEEFRAMARTATKEERRNFKILNFEYATFSGIFYRRRAKDIVSQTPFMTIDIDDLSSMDEAREVQHKLCQDTRVETVLCFVSPSGVGVKWIVTLPEWTDGLPFKEQFDRMRMYVEFNYGFVVDKSGSDVCRACFLPWDNECFINTKFI